MQTYENNKLVDTSVDEFVKLQKAQSKMHSKMTYSVIGKLPEKGSRVTVNGLEYKVRMCDKQLGRLHLEIRKPD